MYLYILYILNAQVVFAIKAQARLGPPYSEGIDYRGMVGCGCRSCSCMACLEGPPRRVLIAECPARARPVACSCKTCLKRLPGQVLTADCP